MDRRTTRRGFLAAGAGAVTLSMAGSVAASQPPAESPVEHVEHITEVRDDLDELRDYAPKLLAPNDAVQAFRDDVQGQYGWIAESDQYDVTAYYYWTRAVTQRSILSFLGVGNAGPDKHYTDHEPVICFVNSDGSVDSVVYSGGHHYAAVLAGDSERITEERVPHRRTHPNLQVVRPWNHYLPAPYGTEGTFVENFADFGSWLDKRDSWYRNGRYDSTAIEAVEDPFVFYDDGEQTPRAYWWRSGTPDAEIGRLWARVRNAFTETADLRGE